MLYIFFKDVPACGDGEYLLQRLCPVLDFDAKPEIFQKILRVLLIHFEKWRLHVSFF